MSMRMAAWLAAAVGVVLVLLFGAFLFRQTVAVASAFDQVLTVYDPATSEAALLQKSISDLQRGVSNYLLTAQEADLAPYVDGSRVSDLALQELDELLGNDPQLSGVVDAVESDRLTWMDEVARPTIAAMRDGRNQEALRRFVAPESDAAYLALQSNAAALRSIIDDRGTVAFRELAELSYRLTAAIVVSVLLLWGSLMFGFFVTHRRVLEPLDALGRQIRSVARRGMHTRTIRPIGPAELQALAGDVEELRRQLVSEIDEARSAREALDQNAPVVAAIRAELAAGRVVSVPGLVIHGALQPAEGVLAGDWWDTALLSTGEAAVVVADISGHGAAAGIAAMQLKHAVAHDLAAGKDISDMALSAAEVFQNNSDRFATVAAACVHPLTGHVRYINAGHHEPLVIDEEGAVVQRLRRTGPVMSWLGGHWDIATTQLAEGHTLLIYSDGLTESHDFEGNELGEEQLVAWLAAVPADQRAPDRLVPWLIGEARQRAIDWKRDDVTIVVVARPKERARTHQRGGAIRQRLTTRTAGSVAPETDDT